MRRLEDHHTATVNAAECFERMQALDDPPERDYCEPLPRAHKSLEQMADEMRAVLRGAA